MLISLLLRIVATIFTNRPPGISLGQCSPYASYAVRELESRHFRIQFSEPSRIQPAQQKRVWAKAPATLADGFEGEWSCKP